MPRRFHLVTQRLCPAFQRELRCRVAADTRKTCSTGDRRDHDDVPEALPPHLRQQGPRYGHRPEEVGVELLAQLCVGYILGESRHREAGVIDERMQRLRTFGI